MHTHHFDTLSNTAVNCTDEPSETYVSVKPPPRSTDLGPGDGDGAAAGDDDGDGAATGDGDGEATTPLAGAAKPAAGTFVSETPARHKNVP
jgi:hypothetical protein